MKKRLLLLTGMMMGLAVLAMAAGKKFTLVIDAGHGGHDAGAIGAVTKEKTINLNVALAFGRYVERNCPDVNVIYTRKTDVFVPLHTRADIANRNKADLFVSIHTNSLPGKRVARGMETYTLGMHRAADNLDVAKRENSVILIEKDYKQRYQGFDPNSAESYIMFEFIQDHNMAQSVELAKFIQKRACALANRPNKGVKQAGFLVLRETSMPSCLIELGFISTADEEQFLHSESGVDKMGKGIYQAFLDYKKKYDKNITVPLKAETQKEVNIPTVVPQKEEPAVKEEKPKRAKSKMAQELAAIREGKSLDQGTQPEKAVANNVDSILMQAPETTPTAAPQTSATPAVATALASVTPASAPATPASAPTAPASAPATPASTPTASTSAPATPSPAPAAPASAPAASTSARPVFKLQILAASTKLKNTDPQLKGQKDADCYEEGGLYKYTLGASEDYNEIYQLRKAQLANFPQAFIIAFKDGQKVNVQDAIREFKADKSKKAK